MSGLNLTRQPLGGLRDVPLPTVVGSDLQHEAAVARGAHFRLAHGSLKLRMKARAVADDPQADLVLVQTLGFTAQCREKQLHQRTNLFGRALPVFTGEREQCQHFDPGFGADLDNGPHGIDTRLMACNAWQQAFLRPAIITIHDNRDMARHRRRHGRFYLFHESVRNLKQPSDRLLSA